MLKRLWLILGPVFCAFLLVLGLLLFYPTQLGHNFTTEKKAAVTLTAEGFKSRTQKVRAFSDKEHNFVPFFGSSEWLRFDSMHPSVLAERYNRSYRPYLLGQRGAASLTQYFGMQQILPAIEKKSVVYVVSPQWFTKTGYNAGAFQSYFSSDQLTSFLDQQEGTDYQQYAAQRLLKLYPNVAMADSVKKIANHQALSSWEETKIGVSKGFNWRMDTLFSPFTSTINENYDRLIKPQLGRLPNTFSYDVLEKIATADAKKYTSNNDLGIDNKFYNQRLKNKIGKMRGKQKNISYIKSPEYNDLQLVLNQFAASKTNVMFVIPPVNAKWMAYTGLNQDMYNKAVAKIRYQLESQGFTNIADFSKDGDKPYFMQDTIHLGWNGWLAFDKAVNPFLSHLQPAPTYKLNNQFFSKEWAQYDGEVGHFGKE